MAQKLDKKKVGVMRRLDKEGVPLRRIAEALGVSPLTVRLYLRSEQIGTQSRYEYYRMLGYIPLGSKKKKKQRSVWSEYQNNLAIDRGYESFYAYQLYRFKVNGRKPRYQVFRSVVRGRLRDLDKSFYRVAQEIGVTPSAISAYAKGRALPNPENAKKLFVALALPFNSLDDFFDEHLS